MKNEALAGKLVSVKISGDKTFLNQIPDGLTPFYSGVVIVLAGDQAPEVPLNGTVFNELAVSVRGDVVILSQDSWHEAEAEREEKLKAAQLIELEKKTEPQPEIVTEM